MMGVASPETIARVRSALVAIVGDAHVLTQREDVIAYGFDGTFFANTPPLVVLPGSTAEVAAIHRLANRERIAITPRAMRSIASRSRKRA
jgi:glycolate oxidase